MLDWCRRFILRIVIVMRCFESPKRKKVMKKFLFKFLALSMMLSGFALAKDADLNLGSALKLTQEEQAFIQDHPEIRLSPDPDFLPIEFIGKSEKYEGIAADYIHLMEKNWAFVLRF